jgi:hypothetical protein
MKMLVRKFFGAMLERSVAESKKTCVYNPLCVEPVYPRGGLESDLYEKEFFIVPSTPWITTSPLDAFLANFRASETASL